MAPARANDAREDQNVKVWEYFTMSARGGGGYRRRQLRFRIRGIEGNGRAPRRGRHRVDAGDGSQEFRAGPVERGAVGQTDEFNIFLGNDEIGEVKVQEPARVQRPDRVFVDHGYGIATGDDGSRLLLARTYLDTGRSVEAAEVASTISEGPDRPVGLAARTLLAAAHEASGDAQAALATWETLGESARFAFQRREALAAAARILASLGRLEEAETIFAGIAEEAADEDPVEAGVYRLRLGEIKAQRAGSG